MLSATADVVSSLSFLLFPLLSPSLSCCCGDVLTQETVTERIHFSFCCLFFVLETESWWSYLNVCALLPRCEDARIVGASENDCMS